jgi:hypothetical protein
MSALKFSRLLQPRHPLFWLLVCVNLLSTAIAWVLRQGSLTLPVKVVLGVFALGNAVIGLWAAVQLMRSPDSSK